MSSTHTPGPWTATKGRTQWNVRAPNLHMTLLDTRHGHPELKKANAMLAAAAPDLLAACEASVGGWNNLPTLLRAAADEFENDNAVGVDPIYADMLRIKADAIAAAISKARGTT